MQPTNYILSGLGGQGILFMTKILARTAMDKDLKVIGAETHGMAQRGGSVISHLKFGNAQSSLVGSASAHFLLALEENEAYRNIGFLAAGGKIFANAPRESFPESRVKSFLDQSGIEYRSFPAGKLALELGAPMSTNLALLGFFSAFNESGPLSVDDLRNTIERISPDRFKEINMTVFDAGVKAGRS